MRDIRGFLTKPYARDTFAGHGLTLDIAELFWTVSMPRTLRGMHFQIPPFSHQKLVWCAHGEILDVVLDLRVNSPTFLVTEEFSLKADSGHALLIPPGVAHGFYVFNTHSVVVYAVTSGYSPEHDKGVHWNSIGFAWPDATPVVSERDSLLPRLEDFRSPFEWEA